MKQELSNDVWLFLDDDAGFIEWCRENPDGFFWNCGRNQAGNVVHVYTLHLAMHHGLMCPHFRNAKRASGIENNLTTTAYCKVASIRRSSLENWAQTLPGGSRRCSSCLN
jgi:hypothetical protein